jgi:translation initiation factor 2 beta subunit (eIF-2beta)/eIF-5
MINGVRMCDENIRRLKKAYAHPFERIPEKFYAEKEKRVNSQGVSINNNNS